MGLESFEEVVRKICPDITDSELADLQTLSNGCDPGCQIVVGKHLPSGEIQMASEAAIGSLALFLRTGDRRIVVTEPSKAQVLADGRYEFGAFGVHGFQVLSEVGMGPTTKVMCETAVFAYSVQLSRLFDELYWGFSVESWTDEFEGSMLELLVSTNEELLPIMSSMSSMASVLEKDNMLSLVHQIQEELEGAMTSRDPQAIGRLHQFTVQLLELSPFVLFPRSLKDALRKFERAKLALTDVELVRARLRDCADALDAYLSRVEGGDPSDQRLRSALKDARDAVARPGLSLFENVEFLYRLRPSPMDAMLQSFVERRGAGAAQKQGHRKTTYLPSLATALVLGDAWRLDEFVDDVCETLLGDALTLDSLLGRTLVTGQEGINSRILMNLLRAGFGYVVASARVMPLLDMSRACLLLDKPPPRKVAARRKDLARALRQAGPDLCASVSFRISTAFEEALVQLKEHHRHSWVGPELEGLWRYMLDRREMEVMELWIGDKLVAADFGHAVGNVFYVATRCFQRSDECKKLQPGFLLAIIEAKVLREAGFVMFDLGGVDRSPMMSYKPYVADTMARPLFIDTLREARETATLGATPVQQLKRKVILSGITEQDLFGAK